MTKNDCGVFIHSYNSCRINNIKCNNKITVTNVDPITGSDLDLESILMYPDNIEPLLVRSHSV